MLPLSYLFITKHRQQLPVRWTTLLKRPVNKSLLFTIMQVSIMILCSFATSAQQQTLSYRVVQNSKNIGWIKLQKMDTGGTSRIELNSEVKKRMLVLFSVSEKQEVSFKNGIMMESYMFRKVNEEVKMNKRTFYSGSFYEVKQKETFERVLINRINYNQLSLYFSEPVNIKQVYSDNFQQFLNIEDKGNSSYMIRLPDGNSNYYYYIDGICSRIRLEHRLFTIEFIRV